MYVCFWPFPPPQRHWHTRNHILLCLLVPSLAAMIKYPERRSSGKKIYFDPVPEDTVHCSRKAWGRVWETDAHIESTESGETDAGAQLTFPFSFSRATQPMKWCHPKLGWDFSSQSRRSLIDVSRGLVDSKTCQVHSQVLITMTIALYF